MRASLAALALTALALTGIATRATATPLETRHIAMRAIQAQADVQRAASDCRFIRGVDLRAEVQAWMTGNADILDQAKAIVAPQGGITQARAQAMSEIAGRNRQMDVNGIESCLRLKREIKAGLHDATQRLSNEQVTALMRAVPARDGLNLWIVERRVAPDGRDVTSAELRPSDESMAACDRIATARERTVLAEAGGSWNEYASPSSGLAGAECMLSDDDPITGQAVGG